MCYGNLSTTDGIHRDEIFRHGYAGPHLYIEGLGERQEFGRQMSAAREYYSWNRSLQMDLSSDSFISQLCCQNHLVLYALKDSANEVGQRRVLALHLYGDPPFIVTKADIKAIPR